jgi:radical SAM protein with 4Fe4S-binding SPASM domain
VNAGRGFSFVDHVGLVYPSGFLPMVAGSVRDSSFRQVYRDAALLRSLRDPSGFGGRCGRCEFREVCGGSRSHAYAVTGDPLAEDPTCVHVPAAGR